MDKYLVHFEKLAKSLASPNEYWTLLLQSVLTRKARDTCSNYEEVKEAMHMTEAYRHKCRSCRKRNDQTHVDFDREKERLFEKGLTSNEVTTHVDRLRQSNPY